MRITRFLIVAALFWIGQGLLPAWGQNTPTNTATNTPTWTKTNTPTPSITVTATNTRTNSPTATFWTHTNTPAVTATNTRTNSPTSTRTNTVTLTPTKTPTPTPFSACVTLGNNDPAPVITLTVPAGGYVSYFTQGGSTCTAPYNEIAVYVGNPAPFPQNFEVWAYDYMNRLGSVTLTAPATTWGWLTAPMMVTPLTCGDPLILGIHNQATTALYLGASSSVTGCQVDSGTQAGAMPATYPNPGAIAVTTLGWCYEINLRTCGASVTPTDTPFATPTSTPTDTPTPGSGGSVTFIYNNPAGACSGAFGCTIQFVDACRALNLDFATSYLIMRLGATCGCQPSDIMQLRLTMGWDEICAYYGFDWTTFVADLQTRIATLKPEVDTPNMIMRTAANDPNQYPIEIPTPMPDILTTGTTTNVYTPPTECTSCQ